MRSFRLKKLCILIFPVFAIMACNSEAQQKVDIPVTEFKSGIAKENIQLLDVRTSGEFKGGHLKDALWADWNDQSQFIERALALDKSKPVYTYCLSGGRSGAAAKYLQQQGYTVYNLQGGISAWKKEGMPVEEAAIVPQIDFAAYQSMIPNHSTVLVDVGAEWCPPCNKMNPVIESLTASPDLKFSLVKIDGGDQVNLTKELKVDALPTFIIYKQGKEVWRKSGIVAASEFQAQLK